MPIDYITKGKGHAVGVRRAEAHSQAAQAPAKPEPPAAAPSEQEPFWKRHKADTGLSDTAADVSSDDED